MFHAHSYELIFLTESAGNTNINQLINIMIHDSWWNIICHKNNLSGRKMNEVKKHYGQWKRNTKAMCWKTSFLWNVHLVRSPEKQSRSMLLRPGNGADGEDCKWISCLLLFCPSFTFTFTFVPFAKYLLYKKPSLKVNCL